MKNRLINWVVTHLKFFARMNLKLIWWHWSRVNLWPDLLDSQTNIDSKFSMVLLSLTRHALQHRSRMFLPTAIHLPKDSKSKSQTVNDSKSVFSNSMTLFLSISYYNKLLSCIALNTDFLNFYPWVIPKEKDSMVDWNFSLGLRVLTKLKALIQHEMNLIGGQELSLSAVGRKGIWETTGEQRKVFCQKKLFYSVFHRSMEFDGQRIIQIQRSWWGILSKSSKKNC